jgi:nucleoid DNA-binding protein
MNIGHYIHELLYRYDCVIVPGFGGFVGNYAPARVHPVQHRFFPPSKKVTFNKHLQNNDGLLANLIAQDCDCSFEQAMAQIRIAVDEMQSQLKNNQTVALGKVGNLRTDSHGSVLFSPDVHQNYLIDSYGLSAFQALPALRASKQFNPVHKPQIEKQSEQKPRLTPYIKVAAAASLIFAMIWVPVKTDLLQNIQHQTAELFKINKAPAQYKGVQSKLNTPQATEATKTLSIAAKERSEAFQWSFLDDTERHENTPASVTVEALETQAESTALKESYTDQLRFHVVGGCFGIEENAGKLLRKLKRKGYPARFAGKHKGLTVVSYGSFDNEMAAKKLLNEVKNRENNQAWLLRK